MTLLAPAAPTPLVATVIEVDAFTAEALAWVDLSNRVVADTQRSILVAAVEPQSRAEIVMDMISERFALAGKYAVFTQGVAAEARKALAEIQREVAQQRAELQALPARMEAKEKALMSELHTRYDLKVAELEEGGSKLQDVRSKLQSEVVDLTRRRDEELSALANFRNESDERRKRLHDQKVAASDEMRELEQQLELLRSKVVSEKSLLETLSEEEAVKRKKLDVLTEMGAVQPRHLHHTPRSNAAPTVVPDVDGVEVSPLRASDPNHIVVSSKLDFGISTLQSVRDQLREIREGSLSPNRRSGSHSQSTPAPGGAAPSSSFSALGDDDVSSYRHQTSSALTRGTLSYSTPSSLLAASSPAAFSSPTVNPWKERLRQLQGDLQSLRADLGAK